MHGCGVFAAVNIPTIFVTTTGRLFRMDVPPTMPETMLRARFSAAATDSGAEVDVKVVDGGGPLDAKADILDIAFLEDGACSGGWRCRVAVARDTRRRRTWRPAPCHRVSTPPHTHATTTIITSLITITITTITTTTHHRARATV